MYLKNSININYLNVVKMLHWIKKKTTINEYEWVLVSELNRTCHIEHKMDTFIVTLYCYFTLYKWNYKKDKKKSIITFGPYIMSTYVLLTINKNKSIGKLWFKVMEWLRFCKFNNTALNGNQIKLCYEFLFNKFHKEHFY